MNAVTQKIVKTKQPTVVSLNNEKMPATEVYQHTEKKNQKVRIGWIIPSILFAFYTLIFVVIGLSDLELLFAAALSGILALMFFVLALSPKNMPCILGRETGISKKAFVIICIALALLMPMLSNIVAAG